MIHVPLSLAYSHNLALLKQSPVNTTDQTSITSLQAHYQHTSLCQHSYLKRAIEIIYHTTNIS